MKTFALFLTALLSTSTLASTPAPTAEEVEAARLETIPWCGLHEVQMRFGSSVEDSIYVVDCYEAQLAYLKLYKAHAEFKRQEAAKSDKE